MERGVLMKKYRIKELFNSNSNERNEMNSDDFINAINQAEKEMKLEWYKKLEKKMDRIAYLHYEDIPRETRLYLKEIQEEIKELENEN